MATRSIVGIPYRQTWHGRYVHNDGSPEHMVPALMGLVAELGLAGVTRLINQESRGWSRLAPRVKDCVPMNDGDAWLTEKESSGFGMEFAYVYGDMGLRVYRPSEDQKSWVKAATLPYHVPVAPLRLQQLECGDEFERCRHYAWAHYPEAKGTKYTTAVWLGREPPTLHDAIAFVKDGVRYEVEGGGEWGAKDAPWERGMGLGSVDIYFPYRWLRVKGSDGHVCAWKRVDGKEVLLPGVAAVFPPRASDGREVTVDA